MGVEESESPPSTKSMRGIGLNPRSVSLRFVVVALLIGASMIPLGLVRCTVQDRELYRDEAVEDIAHSWGQAQRIVGPILLIPIADGPSERREVGKKVVSSERVDIRIVDDSRSERREEYVAVMPEHMNLRIETGYEMRRRGIFGVPAFSLAIVAEGAFAPLDVEELRNRNGDLRLDLASIGIGISDPRGIRDATLVWRDGKVDLTAASGGGPVRSGLNGELGDAAVPGGDFSLSLDMRGTSRFSAVPVGDRSTVAMKSTWPHPSFDGRVLPDKHDISDDGFTASWTMRDLARGFPGVMRVTSISGDYFKEKDVGFTVFEPVDLYSSVARSIKYGVLFVVLTLVSVLCLELATGIRFHFVQYGVTSVALVIFFLTLLALAEHIGFTLGYVAAAVLLTGMISWYAFGSTGNRRLALAAFGSLAALYAVLYTLLRLESFALLVGAAVLLAALAMLMRVTRGLTPTAEAEAPD